MLSDDSITIRAGGRVVGKVVKGKFTKNVRGSIHMLREPRGWALDSESLTEAERFNATEVVIVDLESDISYSATIDRIRSKGLFLNRGHGSQIALPLRHWAVEYPGARQLVLALEAA